MYREVTKDAVYLLTEKQALPLKPMPPNFKNHGNYVTSVAKLSRFLAEKAEEMVVYILTETAADKLLVEDQIVKGVRSGDRGRGREGQELGNFEPGSDLIAKATVLAEGVVGHLTYAALDHFDINGLDPQRFELGVKEVWEVEEPLDQVIHTMGWPLRKVRQVQGVRRIVHLPDGGQQGRHRIRGRTRLHRATFSVHDVLQQFKGHPFVQKILKGGKRVGWGAKTIPMGGYWSMPKRLAVPGMCIAGDNAGMVNVAELKGVHYAMHAGIYAAESIIDAIERDSVDFSSYDEKVHNSIIEKDLYKSRNASQPFTKEFSRWRHGFDDDRDPGSLPGWSLEEPRRRHLQDGNRQGRRQLSRSGWRVHLRQAVVGILFPATRLATMRRTTCVSRPRFRGRSHRPGFRCARSRFTRSPRISFSPDAAIVDVNVTASNCVQCGAITAKGGRLTLPEGGDGPLYTET